MWADQKAPPTAAHALYLVHVGNDTLVNKKYPCLKHGLGHKAVIVRHDTVQTM